MRRLTLHKIYLVSSMGYFNITKREIIASISIVALLLLVGFFIAGKISDRQMDKNEVYNKAVKIEDSELFQYGMDTNVGNAFVYGDLKAFDTVTYPEIGGEYMYVEKVKERYTMHTKQVPHTRTVNGKTTTYYTTETYWTWDKVGSEDLKCKEVSFCGITFKSNKIQFPDTDYIETIKESSNVRYKYYGTKTEFTGTIFTKLEGKSISDGSKFYNGKTINETVEKLESGSGLVVFWISWILFIGLCVYGFYYLDNRWLEK